MKMKCVLPILFLILGTISWAQENSESPDSTKKIENIGRNDLNKIVKIYPNPASDAIVLETTKDLKINNISIYSVLGNKVYDEKLIGDRKVVLNLSKIKKGKYFIKIILHNNELFVKSFIKN